MTASLPLILTLKLDQETFEPLDRLRKQYFPSERNFLPAHITLFHALPAEEELLIYETLYAQCQQTPKWSLQLPDVRFLGRGVALNVDCPELVQLKKHLTEEWLIWLSAQDRQPYKPHVTIQNKVAPEAARELYHQLSQTWKPLKGFAEGLLLWRYLGGPWELRHEIPFMA